MRKQTTPTCAPKTAVAYARYSSAGQRDVSIAQQHDGSALADPGLYMEGYED